MNGQHLRTFFWLRWRLRVNQLKRGGTANAIILVILSVSLALLAVASFVVSFLVGLLVLGDVSSGVLLYVWDGLVVAFLFFWLVGLFSELQRSEALSMDKFLHLPVSLTGVFLINYLSSLLSVNLMLFVPAMLGLSLGLILSRGPAMLWLLPLMAAFVLMVTAVTNQFQGWLAALMVNKRRRRTIIVVATMLFILVFQLPNLVNVARPWEREGRSELAVRLSQQRGELNRALAAKEITFAEYQRRQLECERDYQTQIEQAEELTDQQVERVFHFVNLVVPPGWLPLGVRAAAEGWPWPVLLGIAGPTLIGTASLWRSYRTTLRLYTGQFASGEKKVAASPPPARTGPASAHLLERKLPFLSEQTAAIALASFRSLLRAPESKMMLLTPILMVVIFGSMLFAQRPELPQVVRPVLAFGAMTMILFGMVQFVANQFGFDRSGFRVYVLCPARRRDILLGKNLGVAPLALGLAAATALVLETLQPLRIDHLLAVPFQFLAMYLLYCLMANMLSILAPMPVASGSLKPVNPKGLVLLLHMLFIFLCPMVLALLLLPLGIEFALEELGGVRAVPIHLLLSLLGCGVVVWIYRMVLRWQGDLLQSREQKILQIVTTRTE